MGETGRAHAKCSDAISGQSFTGTSTVGKITVLGLDSETAYTCTVSAENASGRSEESNPTAAITPEALSTGLPIWLLYEATKQ